MPLIQIASIDDPRLDDYRNIPDPDLLASRDIFIAEGRLVVRRLLDSPRFTTRSLLVTPGARASLGDLDQRIATLPVYLVHQDAMDAITGFNIHRGCLAVGERGSPTDWRQVAGAARTVIALERVANPDNIGSIFRNAAAFGARAVLLGPACADPLYRKSIRTSMGAALLVPFATMTAWPGDLLWLRTSGFTLVALTPSADAAPLANCVRNLGPDPRVALLLGHEGWGLSDEAMAAADVRAFIPMSPGTDSLNMATAAAVALYELARLKSVGSGQ